MAVDHRIIIDRSYISILTHNHTSMRHIATISVRHQILQMSKEMLRYNASSRFGMKAFEKDFPFFEQAF